jgi:lysylphosphatidylglycerol synthetase-like protein (DUF2156 family)
VLRAVNGPSLARPKPELCPEAYFHVTGMLADLLFALALVTLGVTAYFGTGRASLTALIPALFGAVVALFALLAWSTPSWAAVMRHATTGLAILGFIATARSLVSTLRGFGRGEATRPAALAKGIMSLACLAFVIFAVVG